MTDLSYSEALEAAPEPHVVLLGPAPCQRCGAWVEWAGGQWLALGRLERHECSAFLRDQPYRMAHPMPAVRGRSMIRTASLHPVPGWVERSEPAVWLAVTIGAALLLLVALLGRQPPV